MPLTPIDVQQKTFGPELRGYNMDEVDDFLDEVVSSLKDYDQRVRDAQDRIRALEAELSNRGEDESAISRALVNAQKQADAIVNDAVIDSQRILDDAQGEADRLRTDRETERMSLVQDIARMRATVADLKRRVLDLATSIDEDLDSIDVEASQVARELETPEGALPAFDEEPAEGTDHPGGEGPSVHAEDPGYVDDSGYVVDPVSEYADVEEMGEPDGVDDAEELDDIVERGGHASSMDDVEVGHGLDPFGEPDEDRRGDHLDDEPERRDDDAVEDAAYSDDPAHDEDQALSVAEDADDEESSGSVSGRRPWERGSV